ncbi:hypothetical protein [Ornithinicoccus hortensis]|uniref:Vitamin K-dependent gamma-carboxylase-like protein n=1 Tax=Ornithinicoccus hortensis TaxID=82346 RepID=A0A542YSD4_9MICO|nr:hypothetical protein [Ornithinicoccus hortensis]TQL51013.1 vitamin K-dependent gamma-carboxylase-like protein [Ornithinicoccus hortensis]
MRVLRAVAGWWVAPVPRARVAWVRVLVGTMALLDALVFLRSPRDRSGTPEFYDPVPVASALGLPAPTGAVPTLLLVGIAAGLVGVALGARARVPAAVQVVGGLLLSGCYAVWCLYGMSFGYVAHDHMAIMVAMLVLPTAGVCRYRDPDRSGGAGWALRMVQVFTVLTYTGSVLAKAVLNDWDLVRWGNSGTLVWAFLRRPNPVNVHLVDQALLLRASQWGAMALELLAPAVFLVREHRRWLVVLFFVGFHLSTFVLLGIHFLPTVVCWSAFLPWERYAAWLRHRRTTRTSARRSRGRSVRRDRARARR